MTDRRRRRRETEKKTERVSAGVGRRPRTPSQRGHRQGKGPRHVHVGSAEVDVSPLHPLLGARAWLLRGCCVPGGPALILSPRGRPGRKFPPGGKMLLIMPPDCGWKGILPVRLVMSCSGQGQDHF